MQEFRAALSNHRRVRGLTRFVTIVLAGSAIVATTSVLGVSTAATPPPPAGPELALPGAGSRAGVAAVVGSPSEGRDVVLRPDDTDPRVVWLEFDSELLGLRAVNRVVLPADYDESARPYGTLYELHGTIGSTYPIDLVTDALGAADAGSVAASEHFLIVRPDAQAPYWCRSCWWVDGRNGEGVLAESHLYQELVPIVEEVFNVRRDRGGRALTGSSMGGIGSLIQAFRHPDRFVYVASQSGPPSAFEHNDGGQALHDADNFSLYLVGQGYPDPLTDPMAYRNIDVVTLAPQVIGTGLEIVLWANDGCLPPYDMQPQPVGDPSCVRLEPPNPPDPTDASHMPNESFIRFGNEVLADRFLDLGLPFRMETGHGRHGPSRLYPDHVLPDLNRIFGAAEAPGQPVAVSYKTGDRAFSVWGYDVSVDRANEEFVYLLGARLDGTDFTVAGTGTARIRTPRVASPGSPVLITITRENAPDEVLSATADSDGRVALDLTLGADRPLDQRQEVSRQGLASTPRTRVMVVPAA